MSVKHVIFFSSCFHIPAVYIMDLQTPFFNCSGYRGQSPHLSFHISITSSTEAHSTLPHPSPFPHTHPGYATTMFRDRWRQPRLSPRKVYLVLRLHNSSGRNPWDPLHLSPSHITGLTPTRLPLPTRITFPVPSQLAPFSFPHLTPSPSRTTLATHRQQFLPSRLFSACFFQCYRVI